ncbi:uncharacterized protein BJ212DRAFT_1483796 [Suillus subaureus]|uniref:Uncharacterized protein n=1 Tax=Suillus subaureus TaxID=48587 RepID=A0A9P7E4N4_9AGAM|nr:uncharacterized protein BJ212DRAFT_1483796 [Suillus subaureus]KAG1811124.1 hypothetical protein BJ212DRAFT_1483796 [Suillus subaureus]
MSERESEHHNPTHTLMFPDLSGVVPTSVEARAKHRITVLEEELQMMQQEKGTKQRKTTYYVSQGRAIHCMVVLYTSLEDLIAKNDRRYKEQLEENTTEQDRLQRGYITLAQVVPWLHPKLSELDIDDCEDMLKKLLCPSEWDWSDPQVKAGICNQTSEYIVSENSWPLFLYENYTVDSNNLEEGLFKSKILVQAFKATFTSPSSAKEADGDGDRANILENNRRARRALNQAKVKTCMASIINMRKVTARSIAYVVCQVCFALSGVTSWRTIDGDFDYEMFWNNIVDFFEDVPGPVAQCRVTQLLKWWTRKIFGRNHHEDLTPDVMSKMSVTALAEQRKAIEDAVFDSD